MKSAPRKKQLSQHNAKRKEVYTVCQKRAATKTGWQGVSGREINSRTVQ